MLFIEALSGEGRGFNFRARYAHKYSGPHEIGVVCRARIPIDRLVDETVEVSAKWTRPDGRRIWTLRGTSMQGSVWFDGPDKNGFSLLRFDVPQNLPLGEDLTVEVRISGAGWIAAYEPTLAYCRNITRL